MGLIESLRKAIVQIAATQDKHLRDLPVLEQTLAPVLTVASALYWCGAFLHRRLYQFRILQQTRLPIPVISVGNLTWGGTGKTPMVECLARHLLSVGVCPLILMRGYGGGDEFRLLERHLQGTSAKFAVGPNRSKLALSILQQHTGQSGSSAHTQKLQTNGRIGHEKIGVAILDDGMQHWALARDIEIVMVNVVSLWGNGKMVPRGPLRESLVALKRADVVVLHHANLVPDKKMTEVTQVLNSFLKGCTIVWTSHMRPLCFYGVQRPNEEDIDAKVEVLLDVVQDAVVLCVSAIGCPESLSLVLKQEGASHIERLDFSDHHVFSAEVWLPLYLLHTTVKILRQESESALVKRSDIVHVAIAQDLVQIEKAYQLLKLRFPQDRALLVISEKDYLRDPAAIAKLAGVQPLVLHSCLEIIKGCSSEDEFASLLGSISSRQHGRSFRTSTPQYEGLGLKALLKDTNSSVLDLQTAVFHQLQGAERDIFQVGTSGDI